MKRPTWVTVVGVLSIIFGLLGLLNAAQLAVMPKMMDMQRDMITNMQKDFPAGQKNAPDPKLFKDLFDKLMGHTPDWFNTVSIILGLVGMAVYGLYLFAGITLMSMKKYALSLFYTAIGLSIVFGIARAIVLASAYSASVMGVVMIIPGLLGAVIDIVLLLVVLTSDKTVFRKAVPPPFKSS